MRLFATKIDPKIFKNLRTLSLTITLAATVSCASAPRYNNAERHATANASASAPTASASSSATRSNAMPRRDAPTRRGATASTSTGRQPARMLQQVAESYLGVPYRYGGTTRAGFDCSGYVQAVYREVYNVNLPRSSKKMWEIGRQIPISTARPGDLVFFRNSGRAIDHVGIYMGNGRFIHSSSSRGVVYNNLNEEYYSRRFTGARRVVQ